MSAIERDRTPELIAAYEARLAQLYIKRAKLGHSAPPEVHTEIAEIERAIEGYQAERTPQPPDLLTIYRLMQAELMRLDLSDGRILRELADLRKHIDQRLDRLFEHVTAAMLQTRASPPPPPTRRSARRANDNG